jgi:hypothetical protein
MAVMVLPSVVILVIDQYGIAIVEGEGQSTKAVHLDGPMAGELAF